MFGSEVLMKLPIKLSSDILPALIRWLQEQFLISSRWLFTHYINSPPWQCSAEKSAFCFNICCFFSHWYADQGTASVPLSRNESQFGWAETQMSCLTVNICHRKLGDVGKSLYPILLPISPLVEMVISSGGLSKWKMQMQSSAECWTLHMILR